MAFAIGLMALPTAAAAQPSQWTVASEDSRHADALPDELPPETAPFASEESDDLDGEDDLGTDGGAPAPLTTPHERRGSVLSQARRLASRHRGAPPVPPP